MNEHLSRGITQHIQAPDVCSHYGRGKHNGRNQRNLGKENNASKVTKIAKTTTCEMECSSSPALGKLVYNESFEATMQSRGILSIGQGETSC